MVSVNINKAGDECAFMCLMCHQRFFFLHTNLLFRIHDGQHTKTTALSAVFFPAMSAVNVRDSFAGDIRYCSVLKAVLREKRAEPGSGHRKMATRR